MNSKLVFLGSVLGLSFCTLAILSLVFWLNGDLVGLNAVVGCLPSFLIAALFLVFLLLLRPQLFDLDWTNGRCVFDADEPDGKNYPASPAEAFSFILLAAALPVGEGAALGAAGLLFLCMLQRRFWFQRPPVPLLRFIGFGFVVWVGSGLFAILWTPHGWLRPQELGRLIPLFLCPLVACSVARLAPSSIKRGVTAFFISLGLSCLFGLFQYFSALHESSGFMGALEFISSKRQILAPGQGGRLVAGGFYFHRLKMAHVLLIGISVLVSRQLFRRLPPQSRVLDFTLLLLFLSTLALTYTRAAVLGLGLGGIVVLWFASRRWKIIGGIVGVLLLVGAFSYGPVRERILSTASAGASQERLLLWKTAFAMMSEFPFGIGLGNYPNLVDTFYAGVPGADVLPRTYAHNLLLSVWAEAGPLGMLGYCWIWIGLGRAFVLRLRQDTDEITHQLAGAGVMILFVFWSVGLTHDVLFHKPVSLTFAAAVGFLIGSLNSGHSVKPAS